MDAPLLSVRDLRVSFPTARGPLAAVEGVSLDLHAGEMLALVGESGAGKSATALALMGLIDSGEVRIEGSARLGTLELIGAPAEVLRRTRGAEMAMIFQDPLSALNPMQRVGEQVVEAIRAHGSIDRRLARERAIALLARVGLPDPRTLARRHPHELSGGMGQRVMIAIALAGDPRLLIADEPTAALDVTSGARIIELLAVERRRAGLAVILITHDLSLAARTADRVAVMYAGRLVETGTAEQVLEDPQHPYTWALLGAVPRLDRPRRTRLPTVAGRPPSPFERPEGCRFRTRCPHAFSDCHAEPPLVARIQESREHLDRCWLPVAEKRERRLVDSETRNERVAAG